MKQPYLVGYDYGTGGLYAYVSAAIPEQITNLYPELVVFDSPPSFLSEESLRNLATHDIEDAPEGVLHVVVSERTHP